jgi:hypothetical protein
MKGIRQRNGTRRLGRIWLPAALGLWFALGAATPGFGQAALPGDLDGNGIVENADRLLMRQLLAENISLDQVAAANADVNEDGRFEGIDGAWLLLLDPPYRGGLLGCEPVGSISTVEAEFYLFVAGLTALRPARYAADMYKLTYRTMTPSGGATTATGLLTLPAGLTGVLPLACYQHGTLTEKTDAPSNPDSTEGLGTALIYSSTGGYAAVAPDYLGLGEGPGPHPYLHAATEASAGIDMLRAGRTAAAGYGVSLAGPLFLVGYSQGGHATMALQRELEARFAEEWPVTAAAPMAGPYDLSGTMLDYALGSAEEDNPQRVMYMAYLLVSFTTLYDFVPGVAEIFQPPYDTQVVALFDGTHSDAEIMAALPPSLAQLLQPEFLAALQSDPDHPVRMAAWLNDVYDWQPAAPLRMYHSAGDTIVPIGNAQVALAWMTALGAPVELIVVSETLDHGEAAIPCLIQSRQWFDSRLKR